MKSLSKIMYTIVAYYNHSLRIQLQHKINVMYNTMLTGAYITAGRYGSLRLLLIRIIFEFYAYLEVNSQ